MEMNFTTDEIGFDFGFTMYHYNEEGQVVTLPWDETMFTLTTYQEKYY